LARLAYELARLTWQSLPKAEETFGFIVSTKPLIFMQLVLSQLSARSFWLLKLTKRFILEEGVEQDRDKCKSRENRAKNILNMTAFS